MRTRKDIIHSIWKERERQEEKEGYTTDHDDDHDDEQLADAAACYAASQTLYNHREEGVWPWGRESEEKMAKHPRLRQLEIAAALIVAEIERLARAAERADGR